MSIPVSTLTGSNTINQMMYNVNTIKDLAANSAGFVANPGSSTDNAVMRFDGTTGSTAQNSGVTIADDNSMIISGSSSGDMLRITQTGAGNALLVEDSTNPDSTPFVVDANGNVGIGTSSPGAALDVNKGYIALSGAGTENRSIEIGVGRTGNGLSFIDLIGDTTYSDFGTRLYRHSTGPNTYSALQHRGTGELYIQTIDAGPIALFTNSSERMRIDSSGNTGIGTSSPAQFVHINRATVGDTSSLLVSNPDGTGGASAALKLGVSPEDNSVAKFAIIHERFAAYGGGDTYFCSNYDADATEVTDADAVVTIKGSTGNVGIGTTSPSYKLDIIGTTDGSIVSRLGNLSTGSSSQAILQLGVGATAERFVNLITQYASQYFQISGGNITTSYQDFDTQIFRNNAFAERMRIDSSGNLLVGTTTAPTTVSPVAIDGSIALEVAPTGTETVGIYSEATGDATSERRAAIEFVHTAGGGGSDSVITFTTNDFGVSRAERMRIDNSGNVGIGTSIPDKRLHVLSTDVNGGVAVFENTATTQYATGGIIVKNGASSSGKHVLIGTAVRDGDGSDSVFTINRVNDDATLTFDAGLATYDLTADFWTFSTGGTERMRIDSSGNVGIGATPTVELDIVGNKASSVANRVYNQSTSAGSQSVLSLQTGSANHLVNIVMNDNTGSGYFQFSSDTGVQAAYYDFAQHIFRSQGGSERMRIDSSGKVGIGTTAPSTTLDVSGTARATQGMPIITEAGTAKTLALTDNGGYVRTTSGSAVTITVPLNSSVAFPTGAEIVVFQDGAGLVTFAATGGVTIKSKDSNLSLGGQYSIATLKKVDTDTWDLIGDLA